MLVHRNSIIKTAHHHLEFTTWSLGVRPAPPRSGSVRLDVGRYRSCSPVAQSECRCPEKNVQQQPPSSGQRHGCRDVTRCLHGGRTSLPRQIASRGIKHEPGSRGIDRLGAASGRTGASGRTEAGPTNIITGGISIKCATTGPALNRSVRSCEGGGVEIDAGARKYKERDSAMKMLANLKLRFQQTCSSLVDHRVSDLRHITRPRAASATSASRAGGSCFFYIFKNKLTPSPAVVVGGVYSDKHSASLVIESKGREIRQRFLQFPREREVASTKKRRALDFRMIYNFFTRAKLN